MKKMIFLLITSLSLSLSYGCQSAAAQKEDPSMQLFDSEEIKPASPVNDFTLEKLVENTGDLLNSALESYQIMTDDAARTDAPQKGIKAAKKVQKQYGERLTELKAADLSGYSSEDLYSLSEEISNIISAIREARDLLSGI